MRLNSVFIMLWLVIFPISGICQPGMTALQNMLEGSGFYIGETDDQEKFSGRIAKGIPAGIWEGIIEHEWVILEPNQMTEGLDNSEFQCITRYFLVRLRELLADKNIPQMSQQLFNNTMMRVRIEYILKRLPTNIAEVRVARNRAAEVFEHRERNAKRALLNTVLKMLDSVSLNDWSGQSLFFPQPPLSEILASLAVLTGESIVLVDLSDPNIIQLTLIDGQQDVLEESVKTFNISPAELESNQESIIKYLRKAQMHFVVIDGKLYPILKIGEEYTRDTCQDECEYGVPRGTHRDEGSDASDSFDEEASINDADAQGTEGGGIQSYFMWAAMPVAGLTFLYWLYSWLVPGEHVENTYREKSAQGNK